MKNLKLIFVLAISLVALSCGNDDDGDSNTPDEPTLTPELLAGTYDLNFFNSTDITLTEVSGGTVTTITRRVGSIFDNSQIVFDANGTFTADFGYAIEQSLTLEDNDPEENDFIVMASTSGSYTVNDDEQTLTLNSSIEDNGNSDLVLVNAFNNVTLFNDSVLRITSEEVETADDETTTFTSELRFARQ